MWGWDKDERTLADKAVFIDSGGIHTANGQLQTLQGVLGQRLFCAPPPPRILKPMQMGGISRESRWRIVVRGAFWLVGERGRGGEGGEGLKVRKVCTR